MFRNFYSVIFFFLIRLFFAYSFGCISSKKDELPPSHSSPQKYVSIINSFPHDMVDTCAAFLSCLSWHLNHHDLLDPTCKNRTRETSPCPKPPCNLFTKSYEALIHWDVDLNSVVSLNIPFHIF